jgi:hypothetical protein
MIVLISILCLWIELERLAELLVHLLILLIWGSLGLVVIHLFSLRVMLRLKLKLVHLVMWVLCVSVWLVVRLSIKFVRFKRPLHWG